MALRHTQLTFVHAIHLGFNEIRVASAGARLLCILTLPQRLEATHVQHGCGHGDQGAG